MIFSLKNSTQIQFSLKFSTLTIFYAQNLWNFIFSHLWYYLVMFNIILNVWIFFPIFEKILPVTTRSLSKWYNFTPISLNLSTRTFLSQNCFNKHIDFYFSVINIHIKLNIMNETTYEERLASKNVLKIFSLKFSTWKLSYIYYRWCSKIWRLRYNLWMFNCMWKACTIFLIITS